MESVLVKNQKKVFGPTRLSGYGEPAEITATVRYDDECSNGHNSFSITGDIKTPYGRWLSGGCVHDETIKAFPKLEKYIKWHLTSSDGPMHYIANTLYHAKAISPHQDEWYFYLEHELIKIVDGIEKIDMVKKYGDNAVFKEYLNSMAKDPELEAARSSAVWPEATIEQLQDEAALKDRLPALLAAFKSDIEELGFDW